MGTLILIAVLMAVGLYNLLSHLLGIPPISSIRALARLTGSNAGPKERMMSKAATMIQPLVSKCLSPYQKDQLQKKLDAAESVESPEYFTSRAVADALIYLVVGMCLLPVMPPIGPIFTGVLAFIAVRMFIRDMKVPFAEQKKAQIEAEAPRFASYVAQSVRHKADLPSIIEGYRPAAGKVFGHELDVLIADMRTKNPEAALIGFESRISSTMISDLVRGLLGLARGEDMSVYFSGLEVSMDDQDIANLSKEAMKRPRQLEPANWAIIISMMIIYAAVIGVQMFSGMNLFRF